MIIECLPYQMAPDEGMKLFKNRKRQLRLGQFRFDTGFYIPFHLFQVEVLNGGRLSSQLLAIDAMTGELDLYTFDQLPTEFDQIETSQRGDIALNEKQAFDYMKDRIRRQLYLQGAFKIRDLTVSGAFIRTIYLPYWVGFFTRHDQLQLEVIDAIRGRFEGGKVQSLVKNWFAREAQARKQEKSGNTTKIST